MRRSHVSLKNYPTTNLLEHMFNIDYMFIESSCFNSNENTLCPANLAHAFLRHMFRDRIGHKPGTLTDHILSKCLSENADILNKKIIKNL